MTTNDVIRACILQPPLRQLRAGDTRSSAGRSFEACDAMYLPALRDEHLAGGVRLIARVLFVGTTLLALAWSTPVAAQSTQPTGATAPSSLLLGDLYSQVQRANPRVAAARSLARASQADRKSVV